MRNIQFSLLAQKMRRCHIRNFKTKTKSHTFPIYKAFRTRQEAFSLAKIPDCGKQTLAIRSSIKKKKP